MRPLDAPPRRHAMRFPGILGIAGLVFLLDWATKYWVTHHMAEGESRTVFPWFYATYVHNTGTAFGLFSGNNKALLILAFVILGTLLYAARGLTEQGGRWGAVGVACVLGGAIGNIHDRIQYGRVVDFLDFRVWPVFNVADAAITTGTICLMIGLWRQRDRL